jgi:Dolichyl-phosphate-mannose-protein mannosyltransferase
LNWRWQRAGADGLAAAPLTSIEKAYGEVLTVLKRAALSGKSGEPGAQALWQTQALLALLVLAAGALGMYARLDGFGTRPLAIDEYYSARSVELILQTGLPAYPSGGYYFRGPLLQYLTAGSVWLFGATEFAFRLPALLFNLLSIPLAYLYVRRFASIPIATAVAIALLVSSWHVEFARFGRMYAPFQFTTLLFLLTVDITYFGGKWQWRYLPHVVYVLAVLTHELGVLLAPLLFLPLLLNGERFPSWRNRAAFGAISLSIALLGYLSLQIDSYGGGVLDRFPPGYVNPFETGLVQPQFPIWPVHVDSSLALAALGALVLLSAAVTFWTHRHDHQAAVAAIGMLAMVVTSLAHLLTLYALTLVVLLFRYRVHRSGQYAPAVRFVSAVTLAIALGWLIYGLLMPERLVAPPLTPTAEASELFRLARALQLTFFSWPDLYGLTLRPFLLELPVIGLLAALALIYVAIVELSAPLPSLLRHPALVLVITMFMYGLFETTSSTTRYWFHLYPIILCLIALCLTNVLRWLPRVSGELADAAGAMAFLVGFALSTDFNPSHLIRTASPEVAFRLGEFARFERGWIPRPDHRGPAEFLNRNDEVAPATPIVVERLLPVSHYLQREHAIYFGRHTEDFLLSSRKRGTREKWTDNRLLSTPEQLAAYTASAREVWVVRWVVDPNFSQVDLEALWADRRPEFSRVFLSEDGRIEVIRVRLAPGPDAADG